MIIIGIDQSLSSSGYSIINEEGRLIDAHLITTSPKDGSQVNRVMAQGEAIEDILDKYTPDYVFIEEMPFSFKTGSVRVLAGIFFHLLTFVEKRNIKYSSLPAPTVKLFATGKGGSHDGDKKQVMIDALPDYVKNYFLKITNNKRKGLDDLADSFHIASLGLHLIKHNEFQQFISQDKRQEKKIKEFLLNIQ